jgi:hypothetical protein
MCIKFYALVHAVVIPHFIAVSQTQTMHFSTRYYKICVIIVYS